MSVLRSRRALVVAALVVVAAVVAAAVFVSSRSDGADERRTWAAAADVKCRDFAVSLATLGLPDDLEDPAEVGPWAGEVVDAYDVFISQLSAVPAPGAAASTADAVVAEMRVRRDVYDNLVVDVDGTATLDLATAEERLAKSFTAAAELLDVWGAKVCNQALTPGMGPVEVPSEAGSWIAAVDEACAEAATAMSAVDDDLGAGRVDTAGYLAGVASPLQTLVRRVDVANGSPSEVEAPSAGRLVDAIGAAADAAAAGDLEALRAANGDWVAAASELRLGSCSTGIAPGTETPANMITSNPPPNVFPGMGLDDGAISDAAIAAPLFAEAMMTTGSMDAASSFGAADTVTAMLPGAVVVDGATPAQPGEVSISEPAPGVIDPLTGDVLAIVGVAATDTQGRCGMARFWADGRPIGFERRDVTGACTGVNARGL